ncbi:response regulator [Pseudoponticoccus marisrubri]|uniref:response regulator n=1 Tax=Pseudoponticoccus marisrubri TaxID=1685382 RepID=UPI000A4585EE|nr:response regulator [Pseudoponticoccus marisrubri]
MTRILHVEDDADIREITQLALALSGQFELHQFTNGDEALQQAAGIAPDLLLLDVMMPGMSGPELLVALRDVPGLAEVPAIFMTARVQKTEIAGFLEQGAIGVIAKPFDPVSLGQQIHDILAAPATAAQPA